MPYIELMIEEIAKAVNAAKGVWLINKAYDIDFLSEDLIRKLEDIISKVDDEMESLLSQLNAYLERSDLSLVYDEEEALKDAIKTWDDLKSKLEQCIASSSLKSLEDVIIEYDGYFWSDPM